MAVEPRNDASDRTRLDLPRWSDKQFIETEARAQLADTFVHEDRRAVVATPAMGADAYIAHLLTVFDIYSFELTIDQILEVRGDRLCLCLRSLTRGGWTEHLLALLQFDEDVELLERFVSFQVEQLDEAVAELEHAYVAIQGPHELA